MSLPDLINLGQYLCELYLLGQKDLKDPQFKQFNSAHYDIH